MEENTKKYIKDYEDACNALIWLFSKKYAVQVDKDDWVAGEVGGTICINEEFFVNMDDIILMLKMDVLWIDFLEWWDYNADASYLGLNLINLRSWIMGAPRLSMEQINGLKEKKEELLDMVNKYREKY